MMPLKEFMLVFSFRLKESFDFVKQKYSKQTGGRSLKKLPTALLDSVGLDSGSVWSEIYCRFHISTFLRKYCKLL